jgi:hypothetical protein
MSAKGAKIFKTKCQQRLQHIMRSGVCLGELTGGEQHLRARDDGRN